MYDILHPCGDRLMADSDAARYTNATDRIEKIATRTGSTLDMIRERDVVGSFEARRRRVQRLSSRSAVLQHFQQPQHPHPWFEGTCYIVYFIQPPPSLCDRVRHGRAPQSNNFGVSNRKWYIYITT